MDTAHPTLLLGVIFILMLINVFFAMAETALTESHKSRLEKLVDDNVPDAKAALELFESPELAFVVVQIGITLISILLGVSISVLLAPVIDEYILLIPYHEPLSLFISIALVTYLTLLFSEFLPNSIARRDPERTLINCQGTLRTLIRLSRPFTAILGISASFCLSFFGINLKYEDPHYRHFFVQQVYKGGTTPPETGNKENNVAADNTAYTSSNMNLLTVGHNEQHINNFNRGSYGTEDGQSSVGVLDKDYTANDFGDHHHQDEIMLMVNIDDTECMGYHNSVFLER